MRLVATLCLLAFALLPNRSAADEGPADLYVFGEGFFALPDAAEDAASGQLIISDIAIRLTADATGRRIPMPDVRGRVRATFLVDGLEPKAIVLLPTAEQARLRTAAEKLEIVLVGPAGSPVAKRLPTSRAVDRITALSLLEPDVIIIDFDALADATPAEQSALRDFAAEGTQVLILPQKTAAYLDTEFVEFRRDRVEWSDEPIVRRLRQNLFAEDLQPNEGFLAIRHKNGSAIASLDEDTAAVVYTADGVLLWQFPLDTTDARVDLLLTAFLEQASKTN
ncbi:MAG: hypothetical protein AAF561_02665 [Planctomycetota bacterium]